jgi:hypothetical protein
MKVTMRVTLFFVVTLCILVNVPEDGASPLLNVGKHLLNSNFQDYWIVQYGKLEVIMLERPRHS